MGSKHKYYCFPSNVAHSHLASPQPPLLLCSARVNISPASSPHILAIAGLGRHPAQKRTPGRSHTHTVVIQRRDQPRRSGRLHAPLQRSTRALLHIMLTCLTSGLTFLHRSYLPPALHSIELQGRTRPVSSWLESRLAPRFSA